MPSAETARRQCAAGLLAALWLGLACASGAEAPLEAAAEDPDSIEAEASGQEDAAIDSQRARRLLEELRCLVCQNQSLYDSQAELARSLRAYTLSKMREGLSDQEIRDDLVAKYGDFVLYRPPLAPRTWLLWLLPPLLALGAAAIAFLLGRRGEGAAPERLDEEGLR